MTTPRLATIPFEHVEAELAGFPLASEASFRQCSLTLEPYISRHSALWRAAENEVLRALPSVPGDEAATLRDRLWFHGSDLGEMPASKQDLVMPIPLNLYLRRLSRSYLDERGRPLVQDPKSPDWPSARLRWSWMCQALPPDLLRTARGVPDPNADPYTLTPNVEHLLKDGGFAETHVHLGAAVDFPILWAGLMAGLRRSGMKHGDFASPGACFEDGRFLADWLLHAAVARLVMGEFLFGATGSDGFHRFLFDKTWRLDAVAHTRLLAVLDELRNGQRDSPRQRRPGSRSQTEHLARDFARTQGLYRKLIQPPMFRTARFSHGQPKTRLETFASDPLATVAGWHSRESHSPETLWVEQALRYLEGKNGREDTDFARIFWQVIRVRCLLYRHVVQRPMTPGLQWFVRFFSRIKPIRKHLSKQVLGESAVRLYGENTGLKSLELRLGTDESVTECLAKLRMVEGLPSPRPKKQAFRFFKNLDVPGWKDAPKPKFEIGALFHFSRDRGGGWRKGNANAHGFNHAYPGKVRSQKKPTKEEGNPTGFRFARFYMAQRRQAQALESLLRKYPNALRTFRGIDLCTDEAGVPIWVMAPLVRWVRQAGVRASLLSRKRGGTELRPLRTSVHAGEDFVHLLSGLRRIDETVTHLSLEEGDRLGHALALGVDPESWCRHTGRVVQPREERLLDLLWERRCYSAHGIPDPPGRFAYVNDQISRLARAIFSSGQQGPHHSAEELMAFVDALHRESELKALGFPDKPGKAEENGLLRLYLRDEGVWRRGRVPEIVDFRACHQEGAALLRLQDGLQQKVGRLCLTVEVNPSSNLLIGAMGNYEEHPLWRLWPDKPETGKSPISVCIGTDDPVTFATNLPQEFQLLFDAMILRRRTNNEALERLDKARLAGMQSRFTLDPEAVDLTRKLRHPNLLEWERPERAP